MARKVVVVHLKWWWQLFLRYFEFSSLSRVQGAHFNCLSIHLVWVCHVRGGVLPQTFFPLSPTNEACNVDHLSCVSLLELVSVLGQGPRPNTLFWALAPTIYLYIYWKIISKNISYFFILTKNIFFFTHFFLYYQTLKNTEDYLYTRFSIETNRAI